MVTVLALTSTFWFLSDITEAMHRPNVLVENPFNTGGHPANRTTGTEQAIETVNNTLHAPQKNLTRHFRGDYFTPPLFWV